MLSSVLLVRGHASRAAVDSLARPAAAGDAEAFEELVRSLQRRVRGLAYRHVHDFAEAEDLAQEIFLRLYRNLRRFDSRRPFEPWFWKLAYNACLNYTRRHRLLAQELTETAAVAADESGLREALAALEPGYRLPLLLHYYAGLSLEQVAAAMRLSVAAVKSRMHRGRRRLRRTLSQSALC